MPHDDLQPRAIGILKAKNRLSADDAKQVEEAFAARMAQQEPSVEALTTDQSTPCQPAQILPQPLPAQGDVAKRPRGRPRKIQPPSEKAAVVLPAPTVDDSASPRHDRCQQDFNTGLECK